MHTIWNPYETHNTSPENRDGPEWVRPATEHFPNYTREERPYGYSEFFIFGRREDIVYPSQDQIDSGALPIHAEYSDRLCQWDHDKFYRLCQKHLPRGFNSGREAVQKFMREYHEQPNLEVVAVAEGCNVGNGYPYNLIWWKPDPESHARSQAELKRIRES